MTIERKRYEHVILENESAHIFEALKVVIYKFLANLRERRAHAIHTTAIFNMSPTYFDAAAPE